MVSLCDINMTQMLEEDSNQGPLIGDFSKVSLVAPYISSCILDLKLICLQRTLSLINMRL